MHATTKAVRNALSSAVRLVVDPAGNDGMDALWMSSITYGSFEKPPNPRHSGGSWNTNYMIFRAL